MEDKDKERVVCVCVCVFHINVKASNTIFAGNFYKHKGLQASKGLQFWNRTLF